MHKILQILCKKLRRHPPSPLWFKVYPEELEIMLTTDGISEDIIPDKMSDFMSYVMSKVVENKKRGLKKLLTEWSFPGSIDDKTIVIARWKR